MSDIKPFNLDIKKTALPDLHLRLDMARWPEEEPVGIGRKARRSTICRLYVDIGDMSTIGGYARRGSTDWANSQPRSAGWISTSSMSDPRVKMRFRFCSRMVGRARWSNF